MSLFSSTQFSIPKISAISSLESIRNPKFLRFLYITVLFLCVMPSFSPSWALLIGILFSSMGLKLEKFRNHTSHILQLSIVLMGFGMNLQQVVLSGSQGIELTLISVTTTLLFGFLLAKLFKIDTHTGWLISSGTAICGGSAIAAVAPVIGAKETQISFALIVVFILNALALFIFPLIGHHLHLSQETFGYWSAMAIHDTSSVVGAGAAYGNQALTIATTVKLTRTLWIIPLIIGIALSKGQLSAKKINFPWFILLFVGATIMVQMLPQWQSSFEHLNWMGHKGMTFALFLIGANMSFSHLKDAGFKSLLMGLILWTATTSLSLGWLIF